jgi:hypothetical protein
MREGEDGIQTRWRRVSSCVAEATGAAARDETQRTLSPLNTGTSGPGESVDIGVRWLPETCHSHQERRTAVYQTEQLLDVIQEHIHAFNESDQERFKATLTHDAVMAFRAVDRVCRSATDITAAFWTLRDNFSDVHWQITNAFSNGDLATVEFIRSANSQINGVRITVPECVVYSIRQGKIATISHYTDRMTELVQLGAIADLQAPTLPDEPEIAMTREVAPRAARGAFFWRLVGRRGRPSINA